MINTEILIAHIPVGKENAVSRQFLSLLLGTSDREMRKAINAARRDGHVICNTQDGRGYFRSEWPCRRLETVPAKRETGKVNSGSAKAPAPHS